MKSKLLGGILLIFGTTFGAGVLALPIVSLQEGIFLSECVLLGIWVLMTLGAFFIIEITFILKEDSNMVSMAKATLGQLGQIITWFVYLFLLYALLCSYISGCSDILGNALSRLSFHMPRWISGLLVVCLYGSIVYRGVGSVDRVNRVLVIAQFFIFSLLGFVIAPHISSDYLKLSLSPISISTITVVATSFGFAIIVPTLKTYFNHDIKKLKKVVLLGSLIPLVFYALWIPIVQGSISPDKLASIASSAHVVTELTTALTVVAKNVWIDTFIRIFTTVAVVTPLLGVSLSLFSFLSDGLKLKRTGIGGISLDFAVFIPPLLIILLDPGIFIAALSYAGIFCIALLMLLPSTMVWSSRYQRKGFKKGYQVWGGKKLVLLHIFISAMLIVWAVAQKLSSLA